MADPKQTPPPIKSDLLPLTSKKDALQQVTSTQATKARTINSVSQVTSVEKNFTQLLGQMGLKDSISVDKFLKSAAGATTKGLIKDQLALREERKKNLEHHLLEEFLKKQRIRAFFYLLAVYKKKAHAKALNEAIQRQLDKMVEHHRKTEAQKAAAAMALDENQPILAQTYTAYALADQVVNSTLEEKLKEAQQLQQELAELEIELQQIERRHQTFQVRLGHLDLEYRQFKERNRDKPIAEQIIDIRRIIADLNQTIVSRQADISAWIEANPDEDASAHLEELSALNAESASWGDILDVHEEKKSFYNIAGEKVTSYEMADYILPPDQRLYVDNQVTYLLSADAALDYNNLRNLFNGLSMDDRKSAQNRYEAARPNIFTFKHVIRAAYDLELALHAQKLQQATARNEALQQEILDQIDQEDVLEASMNDIANQLGPNNVPQIPKLTPKPNFTPEGKKEESSKTKAYKQVLGLIQAHPTETAKNRLADRLKDKDGKPNKTAQDLLKNTIVPGMPIPETTMNFLLQNLSRFAVTPNKPSVTPVPDKTPAKEMSPPPASSPFNPSPFKKTPF